MNDSLPPFYMHSVVRTPCLRSAVKRGTVLSLLGLAPLLFSTIFLPAKALQGPGILFFALFLLALVFGLLPYKRLVKKQLHPDTLYIEDSMLIYLCNGRLKQRIPLDEIVHARYIAPQENYYGIELSLKKKTNHPQRIFFPYFTRSSCNLLESNLNDVVHTE